jgi:hypothetical protein
VSHTEALLGLPGARADGHAAPAYRPALIAIDAELLGELFAWARHHRRGTMKTQIPPASRGRASLLPDAFRLSTTHVYGLTRGSSCSPAAPSDRSAQPPVLRAYCTSLAEA